MGGWRRGSMAIDILGDMVTDRTMPAWAAGDEVYGRSGELRTCWEGNEVGYVLRVGCAFHVEAAPRVKVRADELVKRFTVPDSWQGCWVAGSKGERAYAWAWISTTTPRHFLLIRQHLDTGEWAYHYCYIPTGPPIRM